MAPSISLVCSYQLCAAHQLYNQSWSKEKNQQVFGKCSNVHGHQYTLELVLTGEISSETGMLINEFDVGKIVHPFITEQFDHKFLNEDVAFFKDYQPTAEWIAVWVYQELKDKFPEHVTLQKVRIRETPELAVEYPN